MSDQVSNEVIDSLVDTGASEGVAAQPQAAPQAAPPNPPAYQTAEQASAQLEEIRREANELRDRLTKAERASKHVRTEFDRYRETFQRSMEGVQDPDEMRQNLLHLYGGDESRVNNILQKLTPAAEQEEIPEQPEEDQWKPLPEWERARVEAQAEQEWNRLVDTRVNLSEKYIGPVAQLRAKENGTSEAEERRRIRDGISQEAFKQWNTNVGRLPNGDIDFREFPAIIDQYAASMERTLSLVMGDRGFLGQAPPPSPEQKVPVPIRANYRSQAEFQRAVEAWRKQNNRDLAVAFRQ